MHKPTEHIMRLYLFAVYQENLRGLDILKYIYLVDQSFNFFTDKHLRFDKLPPGN